MNDSCKICKKNFKQLTNEKLCIECFVRLNKEYPKEFIDMGKGRR